jgi:hypothetical protein
MSSSLVWKNDAATFLPLQKSYLTRACVRIQTFLLLFFKRLNFSTLAKTQQCQASDTQNKRKNT